MTFFSKLTFVAVTATAVGIAGGASAASLKFENIAAMWSGWVGGSNVSASSTGVVKPGGGSASIDWGGTTAKSGYDFDIISDPVPNGGVGVDTKFDLGEFTHRNQPIPRNSSISQVDLSITGDIFLDNILVANGAVFDFRFNHDETLNETPCDYPSDVGNPCSDQVTVSLLDTTDTFQVGDTTYTLSILGFVQNGSTVTEFISQEGSDNSAVVEAIFTSEIAPIPLPAAGWLMVAGLGGLAAMRRRKSKKS